MKVLRQKQMTGIKWKKECDENRLEFNDEFIKESIERTVLIHGVDKMDGRTLSDYNMTS